MNFNLNQIAAAVNAQDSSTESAQLNFPKAIAGAVAGALVLGLIYGVVGRFVSEFNFLAIAIGSGSGLLAVKLGGKASPVVGGIAAAVSLFAVLAAKVIVGAPEGWSWIAYHTMMFDILFCYLANPIAAFMAGGTGAGRGLLSRLPF
jgi:hypothetical protein